MARGYPDFFGFSIFPYYGAIRHSGFVTKVCPINVETDLFEITGKGRIWGGYWNYFVTAAIDQLVMRIYLDGSLVLSMSGSVGASYGFDKQPGLLLYPSWYDWDGSTYTSRGTVAPDQTFGQSWKLTVSNGPLAAGQAGCNIAHTLFL